MRAVKDRRRPRVGKSGNKQFVIMLNVTELLKFIIGKKNRRFIHDCGRKSAEHYELPRENFY